MPANGPYLVALTLAAIALLLFLILAVRLHAFLALLISSMALGLAAGMGPQKVLKSIQFGFGDALGFIAVVVGLGAMIGRFLGAGLLRRFKPGYLLAVCAIFAAGLVTASMLLGGHTAMWTILAVGFFNSIMFPTIFSLGVAELGPLTGNASGLLNMAIVGGAILPLIQGSIADHVGIHHAFFLPVICYLYILFYGLSGSKPNSGRSVTA